MGLLLTLFAAAAIAAATETDASSPAPPSGPVDFIAPDGSFAARFPGAPQEANGMWQSRTEYRECGVAPVPMERDEDAATSAIVLNMMLARLEQSIQEQGHGGLESSDQVAYDGMPARGFVLRTGPKDGAHSLTKGRLVRSDTHLWMIMCESPHDRYDEAAIAAFVDSLDLSPGR